MKKQTVFLAALIIIMCLPPGASSVNLSNIPCKRFYSDESPFNTKIPVDPALDQASDTMIQALQEAGGYENKIVVAIRSWSVALFFANETTPRYDVTLTAPWSTFKKFLNVPIPDGAVPDPEDDGQLAIIDLSEGYEYDFWQARRTGTGWSAAWGNRIKLNSKGIYARGLSARGSGFALLAGLITPDELESGRIDHALCFSFPYPKTGGPVSPATESDGTSRAPGAIPEGARLQLDPDLELDLLDLTPAEKMIARALQEYGMILVDNGGGVELEAVNPIGYDSDPYSTYFHIDEEGLAYITSIPLNRFRVLKLPAQYNPDVDVMEPERYRGAKH